MKIALQSVESQGFFLFWWVATLKVKWAFLGISSFYTFYTKMQNVTTEEQLSMLQFFLNL